MGSETILNCQTSLKIETWESVHIDTDPNDVLNLFLCSFLNIFPASSSVKYKSVEDKNDWITQGIKISCYTEEVCMPLLRTAVIQKQKHIMLDIVKS